MNEGLSKNINSMKTLSQELAGFQNQGYEDYEYNENENYNSGDFYDLTMQNKTCDILL